MTSTPRLHRRAPMPGQQVRQTGMVRVGGQWLPPRDADFVSHYLRRYNAAEAVRATMVVPDGSVYNVASETLRKPEVMAAVRGALEERCRALQVEQNDVARYWYEVARADPRELTQYVYVPCRYCYGVDHQYQYTDGEMRAARQEHMITQLKLRTEDRVEFDELGGPGYTRNRYPMRGPDWFERVARTYAAIERPVPEGLAANADHSCPECWGDGVGCVWISDTRHLSPAAARLFNGVRVTRDAVEVKVLDRFDAMEKFEQLTGMVRPRRPKIDFNLEELTSDQLDVLLDEARSRGLLSDEEISGGKLIDATPVRERVDGE